MRFRSSPLLCLTLSCAISRTHTRTHCIMVHLQNHLGRHQDGLLPQVRAADCRILPLPGSSDSRRLFGAPTDSHAPTISPQFIAVTADLHIAKTKTCRAL